MKKPAVTQLEIHPIIKNRWSPRAFRKKKVEPAKLKRIFEAARWAPSSFNEQPWRFILGIKGDSSWDKLFECMVKFNQDWAGRAPLLLLALGKKTTSKGAPNKVYQYDVGQSMAYITFQAEAEGLVVHQMGGFSREKAGELFSVPEDYVPLTMMAIGYQDNPESLDRDFQEKEKAPRSRNPVGELLFSDTFGKEARLV